MQWGGQAGWQGIRVFPATQLASPMPCYSTCATYATCATYTIPILHITNIKTSMRINSDVHNETFKASQPASQSASQPDGQPAAPTPCHSTCVIHATYVTCSIHNMDTANVNISMDIESNVNNERNIKIETTLREGAYVE